MDVRELDHKEGWVLKNWCFWTMVLEKTLESPLDSKEIKPVNPKGNQSWIFIGRTDPEAEAPILWPPDAKSCLIVKDPDAGKDWRREEKGTTEDEMAPPTQWTWVWARFGSWWWTGKHGVLQSMGSQIVGHDWPTELNWRQAGKAENLGKHWYSSLASEICRRNLQAGNSDKISILQFWGRIPFLGNLSLCF